MASSLAGRAPRNLSATRANRNAASVIFMLILYGIAIAIYVGARLYRRSKQGLDLSMVYKEIPVE